MKVSFTLPRITQKLSIITLLAFSFIVTSCGSSSSYVRDLQVSSTTDAGEVFVSLEAELGIGNISISDITLPIIVPRSGKEIGSVSMYTNMQAQTKLEVELNVSAIANVNAIVAKLPNGNVLPLIRENGAIVIPIDGGKANVYLAFSDGVAALGVTVQIKGLDSTGSSVGNASVFPTFKFGDVLGSAGLYTSRVSGQNGFGLFADISQVIDTNDLVGGFSRRSAAKAAFQAPRESVDLDYSAIGTSRSKKRRLDKKIYRLHRRKSTL